MFRTTIAPSIVATLVATLVATGCFAPTYPEGRECTADSQCPGDLVCSQQICTSLGGDGDGDGDGTVVLVPATLDFGSVVVGATSSPATFQIVSTGNVKMPSVAAAGEFVVIDDTCSAFELIEGQVCEVAVAFSPLTNGTQSESLTVHGVTASLSGNGLAVGNLIVEPASFNFGAIEVGETSAPRTFTLTNTGQATITAITPVLTDATNYRIESNDCTDLAAAASCSVEVVFAPTGSPGTASATLDVTAITGEHTAASVGGDALAALYRLTTTILSDTGGRIVSSPAGIDCNDLNGGDCTEDYPQGTSVTLTASGLNFDFWLGSCSGTNPVCTLVMTSDKSARARFEFGNL